MKDNDYSKDEWISDFKWIFSMSTDQLFSLPVRWNGNDFLKEVSDLLRSYRENVSSIFYHHDRFLDRFSSKIDSICSGLINAITEYLNGREALAYKIFSEVFDVLISDPFVVTIRKDVETDPLLFRARKVSENKKYERKDIFHIPFEWRSKITTSRFSISGYPCLYLSSSSRLCLHELDFDCNPGKYIVSRYEMVKDRNFQILDLGIKPSDFLEFFSNRELPQNPRKKLRQTLLKNVNFEDPKMMEQYIIWYPLIAVCSFMRVNRKDPFAAEYIVPQLLMQALREYKTDPETTLGIRYFSCSSVLASDLGFNFVFPTVFTGDPGFCTKLSRSFKTTLPVYVNEYERLSDLELGLRNSNVDFIR